MARDAPELREFYSLVQRGKEVPLRRPRVKRDRRRHDTRDHQSDVDARQSIQRDGKTNQYYVNSDDVPFAYLRFHTLRTSIAASSCGTKSMYPSPADRLDGG